MGDKSLYSVRPSYKEKFPPAEVKKIISAFLQEFLADKTYNPELTSQWTREIADGIKQELKQQIELPRYKYVVQAVVGEQRGEGVRMGCRCFWDADTDNYAEESYRNVRATPARQHSRAAGPTGRSPSCSLAPRARPRRTRSFALRPFSALTCTSSVRRRARRV